MLDRLFCKGPQHKAGRLALCPCCCSCPHEANSRYESYLDTQPPFCPGRILSSAHALSVTGSLRNLVEGHINCGPTMSLIKSDECPIHLHHSNAKTGVWQRELLAYVIVETIQAWLVRWLIPDSLKYTFLLRSSFLLTPYTSQATVNVMSYLGAHHSLAISQNTAQPNRLLNFTYSDSHWWLVHLIHHFWSC